MFEQAFKNIDDVLWKDAGCTSELDYTEQSSWMLFLKYLDSLEQDKATEAELEGKKYAFILDKPHRWESWAAPKGRDRGEEVTHRSPEVIMNEIAALDSENAEVLATIRRLL